VIERTRGGRGADRETIDRFGPGSALHEADHRKVDRPEALAIENDDGVVLNGSAYVQALAPGRVEARASVDGVEATAVIDIVERARVGWSLPTMTAIEAPGPLFRYPSPPAIAEDGTIYFASEDNHLYALDPDGRVRCRFATAGTLPCGTRISGAGACNGFPASANA
jgi:outer membrane protein assembly factor BamB